MQEHVVSQKKQLLWEIHNAMYWDKVEQNLGALS